MMKSRKKQKEIAKKRTKKHPSGIWTRLFKWFMVSAVLLIVVAVIAIVGVFFYLATDLPQITSLAQYRPPIITTVFADDNSKIGEFYKERRKVVPLEYMPSTLINAFIAAEDARFFKHKGIDLASIVRAFLKNLEAGTIVQGGSTITQQVTKSFFLTPERSYQRKIKEAILAYRIDKRFSKEEVLYLYLNQIYLGHGAYGVEAAAENYFNKSVQDLNLAECSLLAGLPQAPSRYSPFRHPQRAKERQIYVLNRMVDEGYIANLDAAEAINYPLDIKPRQNWFSEQAPYYTEHVRRYVEKKYGADMLYNEGLKIYTAVNLGMQKIAQNEIEKGLRQLDKRQGYRGPLQHLEPEQIESFANQLEAEYVKAPFAAGDIVKGVVLSVSDKRKSVSVRLGSQRGIILLSDMKWAREPNPEVSYRYSQIRKPSQALKAGDVILVKVKEKKKGSEVWDLALEQTPIAEAALLCVEAQTGYVKAMIGGRTYKDTQFNRAIQSRRQPGSAFKPIVYAAALDKGYTPATILIDSPIVFQDDEMDFTWKPKNYKKKFYGPTLFRNALASSRNVVTIKILKDIGIDYAIDYARKLGISSHINRDLSIALGSSGISLLETVSAYSVFANLGQKVDPIFIWKIVDRDGNILEENSPENTSELVIESSTAYVMTTLLEDVVTYGTGQRVKALKRPVAGKTGTTNNLFDAWFVGYTPGYITGTWVGIDEGSSMGKGETGSRAASPIWLGFMQRILKDQPMRVFEVPEGVVFSQIDAESGLLPIPESKDTVFVCFKEGTVPTEYTPKPGSVSDSEGFYKTEM
jgi:penicillin-binding protein 1A